MKRGRPPETFDALETAIVLAVLGGARSFREVAETAHVAPSVAYGRAVRLRAAGLVSWRTGAKGTLHSTVRIVPIIRPRRRHWWSRRGTR